MSEWKTYKLGDLPIQFIDGDRGKNYPKGEDFSEVGHCLFLNAGNVTKNGWNFSESVYISQEKDNLLRNGKLERGDIVLTTRGTIGNVVLYSNDIPYKHIRINSGMVIIRNNNTCYNPYLYQYLRSYMFLGQVQQFQSGSAQPQIPISTLKKLTISLPPLAEQKRIADILSAIDDKIELNRRINANLEQQAQALYKSWFVDFEPFGGKMPEDWREGTLGEICTCYLGGTPSRTKSEYWSGNIPWINSGEVNKFRIIEGSEFITELGLKKSATKLLPKKTTVLAITGATLGQVSLLEIDSCANQSVIGILENKCIPYEFIYPLIKNDIDKIIRHQTGGAQQHINKNNIESHSVIIPDTKTMEQYKAIQAPVYNLIANKCFENLRLAQLRDTLLPKLMSGEITV